MRYILAYGLPGYGPDASDDNFSVATTWRDVADEAARMLSESADQAGDTAVGCADAGQYEDAWKIRVEADAMYNLAACLDNKRSDAPLFRGNPATWDRAVQSMVEEHFPYDVADNCRLYVWESDEFGIADDDILGADLTRAEWREVVSALVSAAAIPASVRQEITTNILSMTGPLGEPD
jgi:hypothetical protein